MAFYITNTISVMTIRYCNDNDYPLADVARMDALT